MSVPDSRTRPAWHYHEDTKHTRARLGAIRRLPDPDNRPLPYKVYPTLTPLRMPSVFSPGGLSTVQALGAGVRSAAPHVPALDIDTLARVCLFSNGITRRVRRAGVETAYRAASCTGALYHLELYVVTSALPGLPAGVYHYGAHDHTVRLLRSGDFRAVLVEATGGEESVAGAPAVVICTSMPWRNAWKYGERAYRHVFWDAGTLLANLLAVCQAQAQPARAILGFVDDVVRELLDLDPTREMPVCLVAVGSGEPKCATQPPPTSRPLAALDLPVAPLSPAEAYLPGMHRIHASSKLRASEETATWRSGAPATARVSADNAIPRPLAAIPSTPSCATTDASLAPLESVIRRRTSCRSFARTPIPAEQLSLLMQAATEGLVLDVLAPSFLQMADIYLIVNAVDGLPPGAYVLRQPERTLDLLRLGDFRETAATLALGQAPAADAAVNIYFLIDLRAVLARFGNRGYGAAQLSAAVGAGRVHLIATALEMGVTGLTFLDDEVTAFFGPLAAGKAVLFLTALGLPSNRPAAGVEIGAQP